MPVLIDQKLGAVIEPTGDITVQGAVDRISGQDLTPAKQQWVEALARVGLAAWFAVIFAAVVFWACYAALWASTENWKRVLDLLPIILPAVSTVLGGAVAYYYATRK